jgi:hypothetical protein
MQSEYSAVVPNWDSVIHKGIRTSDGEPLGYIAADDDQALYILASHFRQFRIPKSRVQSFDGSTVILDLSYAMVGQYKVH